MIKIGLCDDNNIYIDQLYKILKDISNSKSIDIEITSFNSGESLLEFCSTHDNYFDILFLDILMDGINGINTAHEIRKTSSNVYILFVTSSREYALDSYSVNAYGYVLKPFSFDSIEAKFLDLCDKVKHDNKNVIYVKNNQDVYTLHLNNTIYFESNLRKITAYLDNNEVISFYNKLSNFESELNNTIFVRCHRSFLVNLMYIKNIVGSNIVTTTDENLPISKKYLNSTKDAFTNYIKAKLNI